MTDVLEVESLTKRFGGILAVDEVSFSIPEGRILGIIGPNGSGKTTLLNTVNGVHRADRGEIKLLGESIRALRPHQLAGRGLMRTFQNARVFETLTVFRNMLVPVLHLKLSSDELSRRARKLLKLVGLREQEDMPASELSGGQQKLLEFARALMTEPGLVLMDEPFAGVHPELRAHLAEAIREKATGGTAFCIVSHEIPVIMQLSQEVICLSEGRDISHGEPHQVRDDPAVIQAYLGHSMRAS